MPTESASATPSFALATGLPDVEPITTVLLAEPFDDPEWVFEPKYEGFRGMVYSWAGSCEIRLARGISPLQKRGLWERVAEVLGRRDAILDGQIVSLNQQGKPVLQDLIRGVGYLAFAAFDLLWLDGMDLRGRPLRERKLLLADLLPEDTGPLYKVLTIEEHGRALFGAIKKMELGGILAKAKSDAYHPDTVWYQIKNEHAASYTEGPDCRRLAPQRIDGHSKTRLP